MPLFVESAQESWGSVRIEKVSREYRKVGFFEVSTLPYLRLRKVEVEIELERVSALQLDKVLARLFSSTDWRGFRVENVTVVLRRAGSFSSIRAGLCRSLDDGRLLAFTHGVAFEDEKGATVEAPMARLRLDTRGNQLLFFTPDASSLRSFPIGQRHERPKCKDTKSRQ